MIRQNPLHGSGKNSIPSADPLKKGELVLAGSAVKAVPVEKGDYICCQYGRYGTVGVKFQ